HPRGGVPDPEEPRRGESAVRVRAALPAVEPALPAAARKPGRTRSDGAPAWLRAAVWGRLAGGDSPATAPADSPTVEPARGRFREPAELPTEPAARRISRGLFPGPGELFPDREEPATVRAAATREARPGEKAGPKDPRRDWPQRADRRSPSGDRGARGSGRGGGPLLSAAPAPARGGPPSPAPPPAGRPPAPRAGGPGLSRGTPPRAPRRPG